MKKLYLVLMGFVIGVLFSNEVLNNLTLDRSTMTCDPIFTETKLYKSI